jgi:cell division protein FtsI (penicillin-binding protein 3)
MQVSSFYNKGRIIFVITVLSALLFYIIFSYGKLSVKKVPVFTPPVENVERGTILDRNGKTLAVQTNFYHLCATPSVIKDKEKTARVLAPALNLTKEDILQLFNSSPTFVYIKKKMEQSEYNEVASLIEKYKIYGLRFEEIQGRSYPENALASQVIGFMGDEGNGLSGIEYSFQSLLSPDYKPNSDNRGQDIYLTIDANLQYKLEKIASNAMETTQAESLMLIAAQAKTGEILSYISLPSANLNRYPSSTVAEKKDLPAVHAYEPGSVFKLFSVASFIDSGSISETETFFCDGVFDVRSTNGERVRITCLDRHGPLTARQALQYSCNDALAQMSQKIDSEHFLQRIRRFGFGKKTGIELPGETKGSVKTTEDKLWSARSKPTISIGQEISVSAIQMVQAATAFTNGGTPLKLTLISHIDDKSGNVTYKHQVQPLEQIISKHTAEYMLSCMETTARKGTGTRALLGDVSIGVKTGTAQMLDEKTGGYSKEDFISNCVAVFPIDNPQIILYIVITKAKGETYAGRIVAPVIGEAADVIIDHLGIARANAASVAHSGKIEISATNSVKISSVVPDFIGMSKKELTPLLTRKDLSIKIEGSGWVVSQNPPAGTPITENMIIELNLQ